MTVNAMIRSEMAFAGINTHVYIRKIEPLLCSIVRKFFKDTATHKHVILLLSIPAGSNVHKSVRACVYVCRNERNAAACNYIAEACSIRITPTI